MQKTVFRIVFAAMLALGLVAALGALGKSGAIAAPPGQPAAPDTGSPWTRYQLTGAGINDVDAVADTDVWAVGSDGLFAHWNWNGTTWQAVDNSKLTNGALVTAIDMLNSGAGWAHISGGRMVKYNGTNWVQEPSNFSTTMNSISVISPTYGWAVGTNATFARYDGTQWSTVAPSSSITETMFGVDVISSTLGWAVGGVNVPQVGPQIEIARWNGTSWDSYPTPLNNRIMYDVDMLNANYGWAVGQGGTTMRFDGSNWLVVPPPGQCQLSCGAVTLEGVTVISENNAWAVGATNAWTNNTWHWDGSVWTEVNVPEGAPLNAITKSGDAQFWTVWAVGDRGTIYRWDGSTWITENSHWTSNGFYGSDFLSPTDGWVVGVLNQQPPAYGLQHWNGTNWDIYQPPTTAPTMYDVKMVSSNDVWAAGTSTSGGVYFHWDGTAWTLHSTVAGNTVYQMDMVSATDGWAVGGSGKITHYNGTNWVNYTSPTTTNLWSIDMVDANEGWAGGTLGLMLHYQNGTWTQISPNPGSSTVEAIHMLNANEGWAVGFNGMILHYLNGTWAPQASPVSTTLYGVHMVSPNEGWAVGSAPTGSGSAILHYQNGTWTQVVSPTRNDLRDVFLFPSGTSGWIVGGAPGAKLYLGSLGGGTPTPTVTGTPPTGTPTRTATNTGTVTPTRQASSTTTAVASNTAAASVTSQATSTTQASATRTVQATGTAQVTGTAQASATAGATNTPGTPGATETAGATATAEATATACTITFTDVPPGHTFYPFVRCLACRGIINGYPDGTFKPDNLVTRGQLAKIVSQSAGFTEPISGQTFEDVVPGSTFYEYVERLASRQVMGGYVCGVDPSEPCVGPENRPYFRPNAGATRGQLTKIVSNAAGFNDTIPDTQYQFTDVEPGSTFRLYVERLLLNRPGVMSGYPCGGPGEPCDSENRNYFRPNNPLTRGQTAKIVANTFFPDCQTPGR